MSKNKKIDSVISLERSRIMGSVKAQGNKSTELKLIKLFKEHGITGWKRNYPVKGKPDFVFLPQRVAIFVDGCFWHGCKDHCRIPSTNQDYWLAKINRNKERDSATTDYFQRKNWKVLRIWEHELSATYCSKVINRIKYMAHPSVQPERRNGTAVRLTYRSPLFP